MSTTGSKYFTVSEALQAVLDESCVDDNEHLWDNDELTNEPIPSTSVLSLPSIPLTPAPSISDTPLLVSSSTSTSNESSPPLLISSTPKPASQDLLCAPFSKRPCLTSTLSLPTTIEAEESVFVSDLDVSSLAEAEESDTTQVQVFTSDLDVSSLAEAEESDTTQVQVFTSDLDASSLAEAYVASNPTSCTSVRESACSSSDVSVEPNSIEYIHAKLSKGCKCSQNCFKNLTVSEAEIYTHRLNVTEMSTAERDMLVMATVEVGMHQVKKSSRKRITYRYHNTEICVDAFLFVYAISEKYLKTIRTWYLINGLVPRIHGNAGRRPPHAFDHAVIRAVVHFIQMYTEVHGLPQPAAPRGRAEVPPTYLPASQNFKTVHSQYVRACCESSRTHVGYDVFRSVWHQCMPHVRFMTPRTDVCAVCEDMRQNVQSALTEEEKISRTTEFKLHIENAQDERSFYKLTTIHAKKEYDTFRENGCINETSYEQCVPPCSMPMTKCHYTFDFAEQLHLPNHSRQVGPLYFKVPYRVQLFGVCDEARPQQINYLYGEKDTIGENGTKCHGPNCVVSMLHHFFATHGNGEEECYLHADNCGGQNKNKTVMAYLAWRCITGILRQITLSFMITGHTRCLVDGCFGLIKQKYRRYDSDTISHLVNVVNKSASCNQAQVYRSSSSTCNWQWRNWDSFLALYFKPMKGIRKLHHFRFTQAEPGTVYVKEGISDQEIAVSLLRPTTDISKMSAADLPSEILPAGLTAERKEYLFKSIRNHVTPQFRDELCPPGH